jgi:hypothetical protein
MVLGTPDIDAGSYIGIALYKRTLSCATGAADFQSWHFVQSAASDGHRRLAVTFFSREIPLCYFN